jgi:hypothetical protein
VQTLAAQYSGPPVLKRHVAPILGFGSKMFGRAPRGDALAGETLTKEDALTGLGVELFLIDS